MGKMMPKMAVILDLWEFFVYKIPKKQNLKKLALKSVNLEFLKIYSKFQVPEMWAMLL